MPVAHVRSSEISFFLGKSKDSANQIPSLSLKYLGFIYTWNPNDPCFDWSLGVLLECSTPKTKDKQVPGTYK